MKKYISFFMIIFVVISLLGCQSSAQPPKNNETSEIPQETIVPRESYEIKLAKDVFNRELDAYAPLASVTSVLPKLRDTTKCIVLPTGIEFEGTYMYTRYSAVHPDGYHSYEGKISTGESAIAHIDDVTGKVIYCQIDRNYSSSQETKLENYDQARAMAKSILAEAVEHPERYEEISCRHSYEYCGLNYRIYSFSFSITINGFSTYDEFFISLTEFGDLVQYYNNALGQMQNIEFPSDFNNEAMINNVKAYINSMYKYTEVADLKIDSAVLYTDKYNELFLYIKCSWLERSQNMNHDHPASESFVVPIT